MFLLTYVFQFFEQKLILILVVSRCPRYMLLLRHSGGSLKLKCVVLLTSKFYVITLKIKPWWTEGQKGINGMLSVTRLRLRKGRNAGGEEEELIKNCN